MLYDWITHPYTWAKKVWHDLLTIFLLYMYVFLSQLFEVQMWNSYLFVVDISINLYDYVKPWNVNRPEKHVNKTVKMESNGNSSIQNILFKRKMMACEGHVSKTRYTVDSLSDTV